MHIEVVLACFNILQTTWLEDSGTINIMYLPLKTVYAMSSWIMKAWTEATLYGGHHAKCANLWPAEAATQQHKFWMATVQGMMLGNLI